MGNLSVQSNQVLTPVSAPKAAPAPAAPAQEAPKTAGIQKDNLEWKNVPTSDRVKTAIATTFKSTIIPYTIGGALAAPAAGAVLGGFVGLSLATLVNLLSKAPKSVPVLCITPLLLAQASLP